MSTIVSSGTTLNITSGQTSSGVIVLAGGVVDVFSGGEAKRACIIPFSPG